MDKKKQNPPYLPVGVLEQFFRKIQVVNPPNVVDVNTLRTWGVARSQEYHLRSALAFLGLIDEEGKPTSEFKKIQIEGDQFKANLKEIVEKAYSDVFKAYRIEHVSSEDLVNFFGQNYSTATKDRMLKCFVYLCGLAGIESPGFTDIREKRQTKVNKTKIPKKPAQKEPKKPKIDKQANENESTKREGEWREYSHPMGKLSIRVDAPKEVVNEFVNFLKFIILKEKTEG